MPYQHSKPPFRFSVLQLLLYTLPCVSSIQGCGSNDPTASESGGGSGDLTRSEASLSAVDGLAGTLPEALLMHSTPYAACLVRRIGDDEPSHRLRVYADADGIVRFYGSDTSVLATMKVVLDCETAAGSSLRSIQSVDARAVTDGKTPIASPKQLATRPPLAADPETLSQSELVKNGYPIRPSAVNSPEVYAEWLKEIRTPALVVQSEGRSADPIKGQAIRSGDSLNWSGITLNQLNGQYGMVSAAWNVPNVVSSGFLQSVATESAIMFVGLDGGVTGSTDVIQAGTRMDVFVTNDASGHYFAAASYSAWLEWAPDFLITVPNFIVSPGDYFFAIVYSGNSNGDIQLSGGYAWFSLANQTTGRQFNTCIGPGSGCIASTTHGQTCRGASAEWIIERPDQCAPRGCYYPLSKYGTSQMRRAVSLGGGDFFNSEHSSLTDDYINSRMINRPNLPNHSLSTVSVAGSTVSNPVANFTWSSFL